MGLLKEALKTICGVGQWSYAVFWKIGCQNPKLLIWEECHYEPISRFIPPHLSGSESTGVPFGEWDRCWVPPEIQSSQLGSQAGDKVHTLINSMMMNNQVNIVGEGIVGRAAFTGTYQWMRSNSYFKDAHPPEVLNEVNHQFSAGMQTVAVIPVLPHGVVQLGSPFSIQEDMGFLNDVKCLILQLGCIPGALLSDNYAPVSFETLVSKDLSESYKELMTDNCSQQNNLSEALGLVDQPTHSLNWRISDNRRINVSTFQNLNLTQTSVKSLDDCSQPMVSSVMKPKLPFRFQMKNGVPGAEVIPSNSDAWLNQQDSSCNSRFKFNCEQGISETGASYSNIRLIECQSDGGVQGHVKNNSSATSSSIRSQLRTQEGIICNSHKDSISTHFHEGSEKTGMNSHFIPSSFACSHSNELALAGIKQSFALLASTELQNVEPSKTDVAHFSNLVDQLGRHHVPSGVSNHTHHSTDTKHILSGSGPGEAMVEDDLFQAFGIPMAHLDGHTSQSKNISCFVDNYQKHDGGSQSPGSKITKQEDTCGRLPLGDDLFDILGASFKNTLLNENWNNLLSNGQDASDQNLGKDTSAFRNMQGASSGFYSTSEGLSGSGIFSEMGKDNLLDAVVSKVHSASKQSSDDNVSCRTTMTKISSSSVPSCSPTYGHVTMSDQVEGDVFGLSKPLLRGGTVGSSSFRSGCSMEDLGSSCQTTSIYGSHVSSWVDSGDNAKRHSIVSTAYSKKPGEINKSNRKRLKPGENPRPRPKDRQMIQDRVKELREIVPNGSRCSIDALLERTIKHMLFLQSVTKHADKLKQTGESKIINKEGRLIPKDKFEGRATWAFEVDSQSMVCPIIVEDLNQPRHMLVEMLCEEHGFFLEIADLIRGLGLTILKGVMETRNDMIWARFAVEANRDVTRMEIFMSLVRLLEQTVKGSSSSANALDNNMMLHHSLPQTTSIPATGIPRNLH